jgi:Putative beta-lactamase-inhibitor-like, PepSY-like
MRRTAWSVTGLFVTLAALSGAATAEDKLPLDKLPKPVQKAIKARYPSAEVLYATKEQADGKTSYEVYMKHKGKGLDVTFSPAGAVEVVEQEIDAKDLPAKVRAAIDQKYPGAAFAKAEEISKAQGGKMVVDVYEVLFTTADKKQVEMTIAPDGKVTGEVDKTKPKKGGKDAKDK